MQVTIEKLDHYGRGIAHLNNKIVFVTNALPDEVVELEITSTKKKYSEARAISHTNLNDNRIKPLCPYSDICGGCHLNHFSYELENSFKENKVKELITKFTDLNPNIIQDITYANCYNYRNKVTLHTKNKKLGLYEPKSNKVITITKCLLLNENINNLLTLLNNKYNVKEIMIRVGNKTNELLLSITGDITNYKELLKYVKVLVINNEVVSKDKTIISYIGAKAYHLSKDSFFQVNSLLTEEMYNYIKDLVKGSKSVLDLYCGVSSIGIYISDVVDKVLGIEINKSSILDAKSNIILNKCSNVEVIEGKVEDKITTLKGNYDTIIVDPPRSGLDNITKKSILTLKPEKLIYVSCDPVTLARDLNYFTDLYDVISIKPYNLFPRTYHVETITILQLK
jgi:23S rRNA (uracil1939-C5)-methyltransferase